MWERCWVRQGGGRRDTSEWTDGCRQLHLLGRGAEGADTQVDAGQLWEVPHLLPERGRRRPCCAGMRRRWSGTTTSLVSPGSGVSDAPRVPWAGSVRVLRTLEGGAAEEVGERIRTRGHRRLVRSPSEEEPGRYAGQAGSGSPAVDERGAVRWPAPPDTGFRRFDRAVTPGRACRRPAAAGNRAPPVHAVPRKRAASLPPRRAAAPVRAACPGRRAPRRR